MFASWSWLFLYQLFADKDADLTPMGLMADLTEQAMTANDANERLTVHSRENLISALFYSWQHRMEVKCL